MTTVFPADCRLCDAPLERAGAVPVCEACVGRVGHKMLDGCVCCGDVWDATADREAIAEKGLAPEVWICRECRLAPPPFRRAVALGWYEGELRGLIRMLKFQGVQGVARLLAPQMAQTLCELEGWAADEMLVIAVPLFARRERQRGFNQSVLIADEALRRLRTLRPGWKLTAAHGALKRVKSTESSFVLSRRERRRNLKGAFRVEGEVRGREVLLVDDILTSGATARECARVLRAAGATRVWVATLARAGKQPEVAAEELVAAWDLAMPQRAAMNA